MTSGMYISMEMILDLGVTECADFFSAFNTVALDQVQAILALKRIYIFPGWYLIAVLTSLQELY